MPLGIAAIESIIHWSHGEFPPCTNQNLFSANAVVSLLKKLVGI
jgi:hypothetical protein